MFQVHTGAKVIGVRRCGGYADLLPKLDMKVANKTVVYGKERVAVDPVGNLGGPLGPHTIGAEWARSGFYGFFTPANAEYEMVLVHLNDVKYLD